MVGGRLRCKAVGYHLWGCRCGGVQYLRAATIDCACVVGVFTVSHTCCQRPVPRYAGDLADDKKSFEADADQHEERLDARSGMDVPGRRHAADANRGRWRPVCDDARRRGSAGGRQRKVGSWRSAPSRRPWRRTGWTRRPGRWRSRRAVVHHPGWRSGGARGRGEPTRPRAGAGWCAAPASRQAARVAAEPCRRPKSQAAHHRAAVLPIGPATARFHRVS